MPRWMRYAAVLMMVIPLFGTSPLAGGPMTPYQTVALDWQQKSVLIVDMETGSHTEFPIDVPGLSMYPGPIAVDSDGAVFVYDGFFLGGGLLESLLARLDPMLSQWTTTRIEGQIEFASDMDFKPDGNLIFAAEFGIYEHCRPAISQTASVG